MGRRPSKLHKCKYPPCSNMVKEGKTYCGFDCYGLHLRKNPELPARGGKNRAKNMAGYVNCKCPSCGDEYKRRIFVAESERNKTFHRYCKTCRTNSEIKGG